MEVSNIDDDIVVIQTSHDVKNGAEDTGKPEASSFEMSDDILHQLEIDRKPIVHDAFPSPSDFIQIDDESGNETEPKQVKTEICPVSDQNDVSSSSTTPKMENTRTVLERLEKLEKSQEQNQVKIQVLQNEVATYRLIVRALKRRVTELENDKPPRKRSRTSSCHSGRSTPTSEEESDESVCSEVETESIGSSGTGETELSHPDSSDSWNDGGNIKNVKSEEIVVTPSLEILSDDSTRIDEDGVEVSESNARILPDNLNEFIARFKEAMQGRGLTYADIMKWSTDHFHSLAPGKISLFLNKKLDVDKSREMMDILSGFLDSAEDLQTEQEPQELPENLAFEIEKVGNKLKSYGLDENDFVTWANTNSKVKIKKSTVRRFLNKALDEEESHKMVALLHTYMAQKTCKPHRQRRPSFKQRFSQDQVQKLERALKKNRYPNKEEVEELAQKLNTTTIRIRNWFVNRRAALKLRKNST